MQQESRCTPFVVLMAPEALVCDSMKTLRVHWKKQGSESPMKGCTLDEAHLIIQWGLTIRDGYLVLKTFIEEMRENNPNFCVLVMSGTLTSTMEEQLKNFLCLRKGSELYSYKSNNTPPHLILARYLKVQRRAHHISNIASICVEQLEANSDAKHDSSLPDNARNLRGIFIFTSFRSVS